MSTTIRAVDPAFVPGLQLSQRYYDDVVEPLLGRYVGHVPHTAARIGGGSEVLGFDTPRSADHEWGPRLQVFLHPADADRYAEKIVETLADRLPATFLGYPTHFVPTENEQVRRMAATEGPVHHRVEVTDLGTWFSRHLGFDPRRAVTVADWLATPTQALAEASAGVVFHDGLAQLVAARSRLAWYPPDVWRHVLACQWQRISQEEAFVGRCGEVGDELGSAVVGARLVRDLMRLCLLMGRSYPPYSKWLGSAFARLGCAPGLTPTLIAALAATGWRDREQHLARAYEDIAGMHNRLGLTEPVDPATRPYHERPFRVLRAERFAAALVAGISAAEIRSLPVVGAIDQYVDSTDVLSDPRRCRAAARAVLAGAEAPEAR
ncbi:DUF4037 domain-containing protein [Pseudonocardia xinjiangensis]